jgi:polyferredoxin
MSIASAAESSNAVYIDGHIGQPPPSQPEPADDAPLYAARRALYPQGVKGTYRTIKWIVLFATLSIYYLLPFVRFDRGPNAPHQAVLIDLPGRRFYFFFIEIWPQEVYYITGLLILAAVTLFLMNAVAGRVWCGYLCPQTVWTDLFYAIERLVEGDRREHMQRDRVPWTLDKAGRKVIKHFLWLMVAWWTGGAWVLYFADAPTLVEQLATGQSPFIVYAWIGIFTFTTYTLAGHMREQVCLYMCPWPRIQAALTDEYALNVTYRYDRGEPRGSVKKNAHLREQGLPAGDCVDCHVIHDRNPMFVRLSDGAIRNAYTVRILNKQTELRRFAFTVDGLAGAAVDIFGIATPPDGDIAIEVGADQTREFRVLVTDRHAPSEEASSVTFTVVDRNTGEAARASDHFFRP